MSNSNETGITFLQVLLGCSALATGVCVYAVVCNDPPGQQDKSVRLAVIASLPLVIRAAVWIGGHLIQFLKPINLRFQERHRQWEAGESNRVAVREQQRQIATAQHRERERQRTVRKALNELDNFYTRHQSIMSSECPPSIFLARREAKITSDMTGTQAWNAVHSMMASLYPIVLEHKKKEREQMDNDRAHMARKRDIEHQLKKFRSQLERLKNSPLASAGIEGEIYRMEKHIEDLEEELCDCQSERTTNIHKRQ